MFKVKIGEDEYEVSFKHYPPTDIDRQTHDPIHFREKFGTVCWIDGTTISGYGVSDLNIKDSFNRNIGRKVSLTRALQKAFPRNIQGNLEKRKLFWDIYFQLRKGKW